MLKKFKNSCNMNEKEANIRFFLAIISFIIAFYFSFFMLFMFSTMLIFTAFTKYCFVYCLFNLNNKVKEEASYLKN